MTAPALPPEFEAVAECLARFDNRRPKDRRIVRAALAEVTAALRLAAKEWISAENDEYGGGGIRYVSEEEVDERLADLAQQLKETE